MKINKKILLVSIFLLALFLRTYRLGEYPALNADEAALGYNATSLIETGRDEHGNLWPLHFESFGDFKPGLVVYLLIPMIKVLGVNVWAVRILPAVIGASTIVVMYFFARKLRQDYLGFKDNKFEVIACLLLAISPWHIHFSRGAWEVNVATFFILLGVYFALFKPINKRYLMYSISFFILSMYTYHSARVISPLLFFAIALQNRKEYFANLRGYIPTVLVGFIFLIPLIASLLGPTGIARAGGVSIFSDTGPVNRINEVRNTYPDPNALLVRLQHNRLVYYSKEFVNNWLAHFSPDFLFVSGDEITRNKVPNMGQLYLFEAVTIIVGIYFALRKIHNWRIIITWLLIAPIPAALTFQSPHALRAQNMIIPLVLISSYGVIKLIQLIKLRAIYILFALVVLFSLIYYLFMYHEYMAKEYPYSSQYGVKDLVEYVSAVESEYQNVIVTDRYDQPYVLFLFYKNYPPLDFQKEHVLTHRDSFGFSTVRSFGKYRFEGIEFEELRKGCTSCLIAGTNEEIPDDANIIKTIYFPNGQVAYEVTAIK